MVDGRSEGLLRWQDLQGLKLEEFGTGLADVQSGYPLIDVLSYLGIDRGQSVTLYGMGMNAVTLKWEEIDRTKAVWIFTPSSHKTSHRGQVRTVFFGPKSGPH